MRTLAFVWLFILGAFFVEPLRGEEWENRDVRRFTGPEAFHGGIPIDAPEGYSVLASPREEGEVIRKVAGPTKFQAVGYLPVGTKRFYLTEEANEGFWDDTKQITWIHLPETERSKFDGNNAPAKLLKKEKRDFFKEGVVEAEIWEETVHLAETTHWDASYRRAEIDFLLPVKVLSFVTEGDSWKAKFRVFPSFDSDTGRIPGPEPENYGEPFRALITKPVQEEIALTGTSHADSLQSVLIPNLVWAGGFSEGRLQTLRTGWTAMPPAIEVSRLSPPHFRQGDRMQFRFTATRLQDAPVVLTVKPDRIVGADYTDYGTLAEMGGPYTDPDSLEWSQFEHQIWNIVVRSSQEIEVVAPLMEGRGAAGMLELESLELGPSYEADLQALIQLGKKQAPLLPPNHDPAWNDIFKAKLGEVPSSQRGPENSPF